jgi:cbb3-type cytochrome oxidase maturation protein
MLALYITIPLAMFFAALGLYVFVKSMKDGQFDDVEAPKYRIFFEDENSQNKG